MAAVKWGLIGCGDIARKRVAPALRDLPNCELTAVSRANFAQAEAFAREFGATQWYQDWRDLVADEQIDAVYIATPVRLHAEQTIAAANAGKHVLCEKPMALSVAECDGMLDACAANQVRLGIAYYRRFYPVLERIKALLAAEEIGRPVIAQINAFEWFAPDESNPRRWLLDRKSSGGGPMFDFGCHRIELLMNLFGSAKDIRALTGSDVFQREVEDTAIALLGFANGVQATLSVTHAAQEPKDTLNIFGTTGSIHVDNLNRGQVRVTNAEGSRTETLPPNDNVHLPLIDDFTRAVLEQREPGVDGSVGREVARVTEEIYHSAENKEGDKERVRANQC